jgi:hypothetical protein
MRGAIPPPTNTSSWHGTQLTAGTPLTLTNWGPERKDRKKETQTAGRKDGEWAEALCPISSCSDCSLLRVLQNYLLSAGGYNNMPLKYIKL